MKKRRFDMTTLYTMGIFALFLAAFLLLVVFGARTYGRAVESQRENRNRRALLSYLAVTARDHDHQDAVSIEEGPEGDALVLRDEIDGVVYATRIYQSKGLLVEEYGRYGAEGQRQTIGACTAFSVEQVSSQCLRVRLDVGSVLLHLEKHSGRYAMKESKRSTGFYLETLLLIGALIAVLLILARCFSVAERTRSQAETLTGAVHLARNAAEAAAEADSTEDLEQLLLEGNGTVEPQRLTARYNEALQPDPEGSLLVRVDWDEDAEGLISYVITVEDTGTGDDLYTLETAVYRRRDGA